MIKLGPEFPAHRIGTEVEDAINEDDHTALRPSPAIGDPVSGFRLMAFKAYPDIVLVERSYQARFVRWLYLIPGHTFFVWPDMVDFRELQDATAELYEHMARVDELISEVRKTYTARSLGSLRSRAQGRASHIELAFKALDRIARPIENAMARHWSFPDEPFQSRAWLLVDD